MSPELTIPVGDLIGSPEKARPFSGSRSVSLRLGDTTVSGPMEVSGRVIGVIDAVKAELTASAVAHLECTRCLAEWEETVSVDVEQYFRVVPDEDGYAIVDNQVDVSGPAQDELALALPAVPLCRPDCLGLCPTCGTDLNSDPCGGHGEDSESPFAVLRDLFES
jgi:uncharacterized protein